MTPSMAYVWFGPDGAPGVQAHLRLTGRTRIQCCTYPDAPAILAIDDAPVSVTLTVPGRDEEVTADDVATARRLAEAVNAYVADLEQRVKAAGVMPADHGPEAMRRFMREHPLSAAPGGQAVRASIPGPFGTRISRRL